MLMSLYEHHHESDVVPLVAGLLPTHLHHVHQLVTPVL